MSQEKLAKEINLSFQQVQKYERGNNRISASRLFEVSRFLKVPITAFASEEYWDGPAIGMEECAKKVNELKKVLCDIGEMAGKARAE